MFKNNLLWWDYSFTSDTQWWLLVQQYKLYLSFSGVSVWQSPPLCSELLSHLGQSLKVSPINDEERPTVIHTAIWTLPSTSELNLINLLAKKIPKRRQRSSKGCNVFMFFRQFYGHDWKRQTYLQNSLVYDSGNKTAATAFKLSLIKKEKKNTFEINLLEIRYHNQQISFCILCVCEANCSPAVCLVTFVLLVEGKAGTQYAPQRVQPSSPDQTEGSRNLELDLQIYFPATPRYIDY